MRKKFDHDPEAFTKAREGAGKTMTALAAEVDCSLSLISEIESGTRNAKPALLERVATALGCTVDDLKRIDEPRRQAAPAADVDLRELRDGERTVPVDVQKVRG